MRTKILILGARGMLGCELMEAFNERTIHELPLLYGWDKEEMDITSEIQVNEKIGELKPSIVINAAAYTDVDGCETNKELAMKVNGYAVGYLASVCKKVGAIFIHYSTDYVFHGDKIEGYREDDEPSNSPSVYGKSKLLGEELLKANIEMYYLIRTSWLFGRSGKNFVETMLKLGQNQDELKVVNDQHGKPTYAFDLAYKTHQLIKNKSPCGIYHITNEGVTTWYDFAKKIFELAQISEVKPYDLITSEIKLIPVTSDEFPRPAKRPQYSILLNTKLSPSRPWQEALHEYLTFDSLD